MLDVAGNVRRWWFIIHASENVLLDLEGRWEQLQLETGWKLEPCFKPVDPVTSNVHVDPQTSPDADADAVTPALDRDNIQATLESVQDHDNNQASLESCQTSPFLGNLVQHWVTHMQNLHVYITNPVYVARENMLLLFIIMLVV